MGKTSKGKGMFKYLKAKVEPFTWVTGTYGSWEARNGVEKRKLDRALPFSQLWILG